MVITLRDDFLIRVEQLPGLGPALGRGIQLLGPLGAEASSASSSSRRARRVWSSRNAELGADGRGGRRRAGGGVLISFTATRLWELRDRHSPALDEGLRRDRRR